MLADATAAVTAGRFVDDQSYREHTDAVEIDPVELRLDDCAACETIRLNGVFGVLREARADW